ncbi:MarR family winged helix-turn-helix transcriptional regulator [Cytophaga hutchinsonii]|uniref:Transcriptional regulator n=1 Tax=Cytophaga hutchinsonii (strain ATCC 33406 / DSM 1761 / CIP 103989 / NBRC 15051 / NCIMB 9469 / D465) TaxID=269798 RepID=A0A6N4SPH2_CYTH3|nr:MarR family transcriptional regulator [Cytophaga hutchinsonii]ABG58231.1 transcriptional regulator [Cytophaga hutchinsonii ATCC 33406]SFX54477.1 transcriptional regulator [Cytophaga hutchinsonii ATCC 33406]
MRLEDEIKQVKAFKNDYNKAVVNLIFTYNWLESSSKAFFKDFDLTSQQFNILRILKGQHPNPSTINLLRDRMLDKMCDASRLVERLRIKGLVERSQASSDKRAVDIFITKKGEELLAKIEVEFPAFEEKLHTLSAEEIVVFNNLLDKLRG